MNIPLYYRKCSEEDFIRDKMREAYMNRALLIRATLVACMVVAQGCTEPGETTGVAAASGGVLGAGLGAIVGNQTGDAGTGLVIGALAGAGAGAAIGNALEAQEQAVRTQDEALERQEKMLRAQNAEIDELRRMRGDTTLPARSSVGVGSYERQNRGIQEREISPATSPGFDSVDASARGSYAKLPSSSAAVSGSHSAYKGSSDTPECESARTELSQAERAQDNAKKLFHIRRALRLCPNQPEFHNALGEIYLKLGRSSDAEYEFKEALRVDPGFLPAQENLKTLVAGVSPGVQTEYSPPRY